MNNMNGIISEAKHIFNSELALDDTKNGAMRAITYYQNAKARIAEENHRKENLKPNRGSNKIVTGEELRSFFDRNYDMKNPIEATKEVQQRPERQMPEQEEEQR